MGVVFGLLWLFTGFLQGVHGQGVYGKDVISIQFKYFELPHARAPYMLRECDFECTRAEYYKQQLDLVRDLAPVCVRGWFVVHSVTLVPGIKAQQVGCYTNTDKHTCAYRDSRSANPASWPQQCRY